MSGKNRAETGAKAQVEVERPVIWQGQVPPPKWFGLRGRVDIVTAVMSAVLLALVYFQLWLIVVLLVLGMVMRLWLLERQRAEMGEPIEHEISPEGIRRGTKVWQWDEFGAWTVLKTRHPGVLDLVFQGIDGKSHVHLDMPQEALPFVEVLANNRLRHYIP